MWRPVPGYGGRYQASSEGNIRRASPGGWAPVKVLTNRGPNGKNHMVNLYADGRRQQTTVLRLVALAFFPERMTEGAVVAHRNGLHSDNSARNVLILTHEQNGRRAAGNRRRAVRKVAGDGTVLEIYASVTAASAATGMCRATIRSHCNRTNALELPGYSFQWDEG